MTETSQVKGTRPNGWTLGALLITVTGAGLLAAGVFMESDSTVAVDEIVVGAGLLVLGTLLPRVEGVIKIGPSGMEIPVTKMLEFLEVTRELAEEEVPDRVDEVVGQAYRELLPAVSTDAIRRRLFGEVTEERLRTDPILRRLLRSLDESPEDFARRVIQKTTGGSIEPRGDLATRVFRKEQEDDRG